MSQARRKKRKPLPPPLFVLVCAIPLVGVWAADAVALAAVLVSTRCTPKLAPHGCLSQLSAPQTGAAIAIVGAFAVACQIGSGFLLWSCWDEERRRRRWIDTASAAGCGLLFAVGFHYVLYRLLTEGDLPAGLHLLHTMPYQLAGWFLALTASCGAGVFLSMCVVDRYWERVDARAAAAAAEPSAPATAATD